eukprot:COSAG05_NODE_2402_length_3110_cov_1.470276_3_plen_105_part_00
MNLDEAEARELTLLDARVGLAAAELWGLQAFKPSVLLTEALLRSGGDAEKSPAKEDGAVAAEADEWSLSFAVGWPGSGVPFHVRRESWSELLYATKTTTTTGNR